MVQWLGLGVFNARVGPGSIPGGGTKIPQAAWPKKKKKRDFVYLVHCYAPFPSTMPGI